MQTAEVLKRKLKTAEDLHSVVKTMKALAAAQIRQYERAVTSLMQYKRAVEMGLQVVLQKNPQATVLAQEARRERVGVVLFGSDQGMCGQLNDQVVEHALKELQESSFDHRYLLVLAIGGRIAARLEDAGQPAEQCESVPSSTSGITSQVQDLLLTIEEWHEKRGVDTVLLFYSQHLSGASYRPVTTHLLPVDEVWLGRLEQQPWHSRVLPTFTMPWHRLFSALVREYLFVSLHRAFAESLASENASRLASMQGAERKIEERLDELSAQYHQQRQLAITEELLDIVAGFEALTSEENH